MKTFKQYIKENEEYEETIKYPDGVYIGVKMTEESAIALSKYMSKYLSGYNKVKPEDMHSTLIYSQKPHVDEIEPKSYQVTTTFLRFSKFGKDGESLVIELYSPELIRRNEELVREHKFISDFDEYKPHVTLIYDAQDIDINSIPPIDFVLNFEKEYVKFLGTSYASNNSNNSANQDGGGTLVGNALSKIKAGKEKETKETKKEEK